MRYRPTHRITWTDGVDAERETVMLVGRDLWTPFHWQTSHAPWHKPTYRMEGERVSCIEHPEHSLAIESV